MPVTCTASTAVWSATTVPTDQSKGGREAAAPVADGVTALHDVIERPGYPSVVHAVAHTLFLHPATAGGDARTVPVDSVDRCSQRAERGAHPAARHPAQP